MLPTTHSKAGEKRIIWTNSSSKKGAKWTAVLAMVLGAAALAFLSLDNCASNAVNDSLWKLAHSLQADSSSSLAPLCPQQDPYNLKDGLADLDRDLLAIRLSKAVQIDTTVGDEWPDPNEVPERWEAFPKFAEWLQSEFPRVYEKLELEKVHHHGLLYTWKGSDESLKPLLMMAHQDVVPVNQGTLDQWRYPPFDGFIEEETETVWGRGSTDCKAWLVSLLSSVDGLLAQHWEPKRTILFSFGFDEESGGKQGAGWLAKRVEEIYGRDSIAMIVDEGNPVLSASDPMGPGIDVAMPGIAEKGSVDIAVTVESAGGHSSQAGAHTSIGLLARIVAQLEDKRDQLDESKIGGPQLQFLQCVRDGQRIPPAFRSALKDLEWASKSSFKHLGAYSTLRSVLPNSFTSFVLPVVNAWSNRGRQRRIRRAKERVVHAMPEVLKTQFITTTAVDIIEGGVKFNALPESATAYVDHRIAITSNFNELKQHYIDVLTCIAEKYNMEMEAFGEHVLNASSPAGASKLTIKEARSALEPAPWTPLDGDKAKPWKLFSQLVRSVWVNDDGEPIKVAPSIMQGNTDTRYYHNLTHNIIRFGPSTIKPDKTGLGAWTGVHNVNEHYPIQGLADSTNFYTALFRAASVEDL
ncbi:probable CPS1 - Gly-X carboxypeptidase YSCS precursor [Melanopsichium pennsylvanicum]|uniref:Related to CPS1-Gly-X carboxypeptidase YSCS n=2 Tax=Melanopsichium pennsylvanicum TaxID=63383 RepID=A0A077QZ03_9BASI|nr:related to CPS1-Gly-X carboxypeptidase YSCS precursor [Melanopsichium pennsylvanicum 4]SNX81969.1 probable CPS1 - Gly-X carboxypeptidase YSCS precursor [Melanopsichium pennsylvanicum]